jgi:hypothetical protein
MDTTQGTYTETPVGGAETTSRGEIARDFQWYADRLASYIRQRPGACLLGAFGIGYFLGTLASRR